MRLVLLWSRPAVSTNSTSAFRAMAARTPVATTHRRRIRPIPWAITSTLGLLPQI